jgi:16S rRNA (guanine527-N7)-methyltransferase
MNSARIAELLQPFLSATSHPCHSDHGQSPGEACPERSRKPALSLPKGESAVPAVLPPSQLQSISTYIDILQHWNSRINLTAIHDEEEIVTRHFGESLFAARHLFPLYPVSSSVSPVSSVVKDVDVDVDFANDRRPTTNDGIGRVADLGSGAGFPGVPIKIWAPKIALTLIESNQKKATFLREVARALTLTDIDIQNVRAETLPHHAFDIVTIRAVERFASILPVAARLLAPNGRLALLIASSQQDSACSTLPNFIWDLPLPIPQSQSRMLLIGSAMDHDSNEVGSGSDKC